MPQDPCELCFQHQAEYTLTPPSYEPGQDEEEDRWCAHCVIEYMMERLPYPPELTRIIAS